MELYVALFAVLAVSLVPEGDTFKCSPEILNRVEGLNRKYGVPTGLLRKSLLLSPEYVMASTDGYIDDQEELVCVRLAWTKETLTTTNFYKNMSTLMKAFTVSPMKELPGELIFGGATKSIIGTGYWSQVESPTLQPTSNLLTDTGLHSRVSGDGSRRYYIPTTGLVSAHYTCSIRGKEGPGEGTVKAWKGYESQDLEAAIADLEYVLGVKLSRRYSDTCDNNEISAQKRIL